VRPPSAYLVLRPQLAHPPLAALQVGWDDPQLQQRVCNLVDAASSPERCTVIFAHSMGNLILAGALERGLCQLSHATSWFAVGTPWLGTPSAEALPELCRHSDVARDAAPPPPEPHSAAPYALDGSADSRATLRHNASTRPPSSPPPPPSPPPASPPSAQRPLDPVLRELARCACRLSVGEERTHDSRFLLAEWF